MTKEIGRMFRESGSETKVCMNVSVHECEEDRGSMDGRER